MGSTRDERVLVCCGDGRPATWSDDLEMPALRARLLLETAEKVDVKLSCQSLEDYLEAIGVTLDREYYDSDRADGYLVIGWIPTSARTSLLSLAEKKVAELEAEFLARGSCPFVNKLASMEADLQAARKKILALEARCRDLKEQLGGRTDEEVQ